MEKIINVFTIMITFLVIIIFSNEIASAYSPDATVESIHSADELMQKQLFHAKSDALEVYDCDYQYQREVWIYLQPNIRWAVFCSSNQYKDGVINIFDGSSSASILGYSNKSEYEKVINPYNTTIKTLHYNNGNVVTTNDTDKVYSTISAYSEELYNMDIPLPFFTDSELCNRYIKGEVELGDLNLGKDYEIPENCTLNGDKIVRSKYVYAEMGYIKNAKLVTKFPLKQSVDFTWNNDKEEEEEDTVELECFYVIDGQYKDYAWQKYKSYAGNWVNCRLDKHAEKYQFLVNDFTQSSSNFNEIYMKNSYNKANLHVKARYVKKGEEIQYGDWVHCVIKDFLSVDAKSYSYLEKGSKSPDTETETIPSDDYNENEPVNKSYGIFDPLVKPIFTLLDNLQSAISTVSSKCTGVFLNNSLFQHFKELLAFMLPAWSIEVIWVFLTCYVALGIIFKIIKR